MTLRTLNYGNYGIFLIMGNAGFCPSTDVDNDEGICELVFFVEYVYVCIVFVCIYIIIYLSPSLSLSLSLDT